MSYDYRTQRPFVFTEKGQITFLEIRDKANKMIDQAGCVRMDRLLSGLKHSSGLSWDNDACVDRLVELKELIEIDYGHCAGQYRIFIKPYQT